MQRAPLNATGKYCRCGEPINPNRHAARQTAAGWDYLCEACAERSYADERTKRERDRLAVIEWRERCQPDPDFRFHREYQS